MHSIFGAKHVINRKQFIFALKFVPYIYCLLKASFVQLKSMSTNICLHMTLGKEKVSLISKFLSSSKYVGCSYRLTP